MKGKYSIVITSEAFERLCAIRDQVINLSDREFTLSEVLSSLLLQIPLEGAE